MMMMTVQEAFQYLYNNGVHFDSDGIVIRSGMEGISDKEWRMVNECADIVDAQVRDEMRKAKLEGGR